MGDAPLGSAGGSRDATRTSWPAALLLVLLSLSLVAAALEGAGRLYARLSGQSRGMTFDERLGWRPLPNVRKRGEVWGVARDASSNSAGWRDRERTLTAEPGRRRVVAIGDSFTFGAGVDDGERFTDLLDGRGSLEVLNFGVAGYGTDQELLVLEEHAARYRPDVVVLTVFLANDVSDINHDWMWSWPKPFFELRDGQVTPRFPRATWAIRARQSSYLVEFLHRRLAGSRAFDAGGARLVSDSVAVFRALFDRFRDRTAQIPASLVVVLAHLPGEVLGEPSPFAPAFIEHLSTNGIPFVDTREVFRRAGSVPSLYAADSVHWSPTGNALVAEALRPLLEPAASPDQATTRASR